MKQSVTVVRDTVVFGLPDVPTWEQLVAYGRKVATLRKHWPMIVGEIACKSLDNFGDKAWQILDEFGYSHQAVINFKHVYKRCHEQYTDALPFTFWQDCAGIDSKDQREQFITHALSNDWKRADWRAALPQYGAEPASANKNAPAVTPTPTAGIPVNVTNLMRLVTATAHAMTPFAEELVTAGQELEETTLSAVTLEALHRTWDDLANAAIAMWTEIGKGQGAAR